MNGKTELEVVTEYCNSNGKSSVVGSIAFSIYQQQLEELIADSQNNGEGLSDNEISTMRTTLLSQNSLSAHVRLAEDQLAEQTRSAIKPLLKKEGFKNFLVSVGASVIASFLYSILLIIIFVVAQEQIASWLSSLPKSP